MEERIKIMMSFGMVDKADEANKLLMELLVAIREEFINEQNGE